MTLSVVMIAKDEERRIAPALASVKGWALEIVVLDGGSRDRTVELCRAAGARVSERVFTDYADQKNAALAEARGDWVLSLDADERVTPALREEIGRILSGRPASAAYRLRRVSRIFGRRFRATGTQDDRPIRLFRRGCARFEGAVHETVRVDGSVGDLEETLEHATYDSVAEYLKRFNRYTSLEATQYAKLGRRPAAPDLWLRPPLMFLKLYFLKRGAADRMPGFFFSVFSAYYVFVKFAKLWERHAG